MGILDRLRVPLNWREIFRRTGKAAYQDNLFGWAAELAYYFFLALFPALLFFVALASFFPIHNLMDQILGALSRFAPAEVLSLVRSQVLQISEKNNGGLLTFGILATIWSASSGMSSVISTFNQAYHVRDSRSWWRVRVTAVVLTIALAIFVLFSFALVLVGPTVADALADHIGLGFAFAWSWKILQWPLVFALVVIGVAIVYDVAPDVQQEWVWLAPGSIFATSIWLLASLGFKWYVSAFANYQKTYGTIGVAIVALTWFYVSGLALLLGAQMNAVIEHASFDGKDPGEKVAGEKEQKLASAMLVAASARAAAGRALAEAAAEARAGSSPPSSRPRVSEAIIGIAGIALELGMVVLKKKKQVREK